MILPLHPTVASRVEELREEFLSNQPFRHVVIDPFLDPAFCEQLMVEFPAFDNQHATNEHGGIGRKAVFSNLPQISPAYRRFDKLMQDGGFLSLVGRITGIEDLIYDPDYVGGGTHENLDGQELDLHVDFNYHPVSQQHRRLNLILFLNPKWEKSWGGCLELARDPFARHDEECRTVLPLANRAVIFETTEFSWHGFRQIRVPEAERGNSRRSIAVYFYTKRRPEPEIATSHATVYYQRPLASHIRSGYTLTEDDVGEIEALINRRDGTIKFLYERETQFRKAFAALTGSASFRVGRVLTWPVRALRPASRKKAGR